MRSRTRSGRISVFSWPTALWFVSGATTVMSPIGSSACFSARRPRDSTPSSLVTRIRGRCAGSPTRPATFVLGARADRGAPTPPATGSPAPCPRRAARSGPARGSCPEPRRRASARRPPRSSSAARRNGVGGLGPRPARGRRCPRRCPALVRAGYGPVARRVRSSRRAARPATDRSPDVRWRNSRRRRTPRPRSGSRRWRRGCPAIFDADEDRPEDHDRVDADGVLHEPRLEDVHDHEPADAHQDQGRDDRVGLEEDRARTGGAHETNGPKNGII